MHYKNLSVLALASVASAQDADMSICDKYTTALLMDNTPANQLGLLTKLVNTVVIGNYTTPNMKAVPGILADGDYMGNPVSLAKYFDGSLLSSNRGGMATSVNFLDGGGAQPLMQDMPAMDMNSNQYRLLTHLYSYFGLLLGCTGVGQDGFPAYGGGASQYDIHKYMALDENEVGYFITQVGLAAESFGVTQDDITTAGGALMMTFSQRCAPAAAVDPSQGEQLQAICIEDSCPEADMPNCDAYDDVVEPQTASGSMSGSMTESMSGSMMPSTSSMMAMPTGSDEDGGDMMGSMTGGEMPVSTGAASSFKANTGVLGGVAAVLMLL